MGSTSRRRRRSPSTSAASRRSAAAAQESSPGWPVAAAVIEVVCGDAASEFVYVVADGDRVGPGTEVARVTAPTRLLLTAERSALNLLCHLSGIATLTRRWADELAGTRARVRDTRKTTPGLRALEKYAVRCGGGVNHRMGLSDMALVKDNHVAAAGGVAAAYERVRALEATIPVEIEVDTLDGLREAIEVGADEVLLDNFDLETTRAAVVYRDEHAPQRPARGERRSHGRGRPPGGRDGRRLHRRRRTDPLGASPRPRPRPPRRLILCLCHRHRRNAPGTVTQTRGLQQRASQIHAEQSRRRRSGRCWPAVPAVGRRRGRTPGRAAS